MRKLTILIFCISFFSCSSKEWLYSVDDNVKATPLVFGKEIYVSNTGRFDKQSSASVSQSLWAHVNNVGTFETISTEAENNEDFVEIKVIAKDSLQFRLFRLNEPIDTVVCKGGFQHNVFQSDRIRELIPFYPIIFRKRVKTGTFYVDDESNFRLNNKSWSEGIFIFIFGGDGGGTMKTTYPIIAEPSSKLLNCK